MNRWIRTRSTANHGYLRYLKPGALAQLRDSKINVRTHHRSSDSQIYPPRAVPSSHVASSPSRSPNAAEATGAIAAVDGGSPCFSMRLYGPRCPQRKKLVAARSIYFLNPNPSSSTSDGPEPVIDAFSNDFLLAH
ncbi:hypothetical protein L1987_39963 [Smallanthus sonchifolius]|uniref:Uncharacterized protein n=1 Tax=Smallanthus sonchifolius TaxID=185202 RepID=A0ACB9GT13_9ASTR|nr:hypothetical protein L1987_39963 [Smallanthus sonchifolius]